MDYCFKEPVQRMEGLAKNQTKSRNGMDVGKRESRNEIINVNLTLISKNVLKDLSNKRSIN